MPAPTLAFDASARRIDADGCLHVTRSHISKAAVNQYLGSEIPGYAELGLNPSRIYRMLRHPDELAKAAGTFARKPILRIHQPVTVDEFAKELVIGAIGSDVAFNAPFLDADLSFWDKTAIAGIETKTIDELSCGYRYVPVMTPGAYEGEPYDGIMTEIQGNHLALVEVGRAGPDVVVADSNPFKIPSMKMSKLGKAIYVAFAAMSPKIAADSASMLLLAEAKKDGFQREEIKGKLIGMDAELSPERLDAVLDAILDVESNPDPVTTPAAKDESPAGKLRELLAGKCDEETIAAACALIPAATTGDEENPDADKKTDDKIKGAMDSFRAELMQSAKDATQAREDVRPVVGAVVGMDSAEEIYGFALDHLKIKRDGITGAAALRTLFAAVKPSASATPAGNSNSPQIAGDSADMLKQFPAAKRFA